MTRPLKYELLLARVVERLGKISTATDHLLLTRWRVMGLCEYLIGSPDGKAEQLSIEALEMFARDGMGASTDGALFRAGAEVARATASVEGSSVLPSIAPAKREEILAQLRGYECLRGEAIQNALRTLPSLRDRLRQPSAGELLAGVRHRLELVAEIVADADGRSEKERCRAAAAILYLDELHDVVPDTLGPIGLLDDDFALRVVLEELSARSEGAKLHWSERISALWDDLPFLRGVQLTRYGEPAATTWLDRINSYISYSHVLGRQDKPLVLVQPSVACSPLHAILSLIGLLVLDSLTSSKDLLQSLRMGQVYEIDGKYYCRFKGISEGPDPRLRGRLTLCFRGGIIYRTAAIVGRMLAVPERPLSTARVFASEVPRDNEEPIQRFFNWPEAIGAASISARIVLVTTRQKAEEMFQGIRSNGVGLLDEGLVRFTGITPSADVLSGGLVLVVPNLIVARQLVEQGINVYAVIVDGYERLHRGHHDLPFLMRRASPPSIIVWSFTGYYPTDPPTWLREYRRLEVSPEDLASILELDGEIDDSMAPSRASLWEAATGPSLTKVLVDPSAEEQELLDAIKEFREDVRKSSCLPEYWQYQLVSSATMLRSAATATPAYWSDIRDMAASWKAAFDEQWATLRPRIAEALEPIAKSHQKILEILGRISTERNTKADALFSFLAREADDEVWRVVCDRSEQVRLVGRLAQRQRASGFEPVLLRDLKVCSVCIVVGWRNISFGRKLWAHTPRRLFGLVSEREGQNWDRMARHARESSGDDSLLKAVGHQTSKHVRLRKPVETEPTFLEVAQSHESDVFEDRQSLVPCIFVWFADEPEGKVLARDTRIFMKIGDQAKEGPAHRIRPEDRIILRPGSATRWSPADEFTEAVVEAVEASNPKLVQDAKEWRWALLRLCEACQGSLETLKAKLERVGVVRELPTLDGWLRLDQAAPIGPRHIHKELDAIWKLVEGCYTQSSAAGIADACSRLRSLRSAAGRTMLKLWEGRAVDLGLNEVRLNDLVERLKKEVQVHEVDAVTYGHVPEAMLGWWISPDLAAAFELTEVPSVHECAEDMMSEDD